MIDPVLEGFLARQYEEGVALAAASDLLALLPLPGAPPRRYLAQFSCRGLVKKAGGLVEEADRFVVGISFDDDYLRRVDPFRVLTWLDPRNVFHPNIGSPPGTEGAGPWICLGRLFPGTGLVEILYQVFEIVTYHKWSPHDGLDLEACQWARNHRDRFPVDRRPLRRRS